MAGELSCDVMLDIPLLMPVVSGLFSSYLALKLQTLNLLFRVLFTRGRLLILQINASINCSFLSSLRNVMELYLHKLCIF